MNMFDFTARFDRLGRNYKKEFDREQTGHLYLRLKDLPADELDALVNRLIERCKFMPSIAEIMVDAAEPLKALGQRTKTSTGTCRSCFGTGLKSARSKNTNEAPFAFRCDDCRSADMTGLSRSIPIWQSHLKDNLTLV